MRRTAASTLLILLVVLASLPRAQGTPPPTPLTLVSTDGRRTVPTIVQSGQELIALDEIAGLFQVAVREDTLVGDVTISYRGRTVVASTTQPMASVSGRILNLPSPLVRAGQRWLAPVEFLPRALGPIYDRRIELRRAARLLLVGDVRVPRVTARIDTPGPPTRATIDIAPALPTTQTTEAGRVIIRVDADALELALPANGAGLIEQIRAGDQQNTVTLVLAAAAGAPRATITTADNVTRVVVEVAGTTSSEAVPARPPAAPAFDPGPPPLPPVTRAALATVAIDPGHGGDDRGARGAAGIAEKQVTLDLARRLRTRLESRLGIRVLMTRDDDRALTSDERAAVANNGKADLFLSLHANSAPVAGVAGAEVIHLRLEGEAEDARRAAAADAASLPVLSGGTRTIDVLPWELAQARHVDASAVLATALEEELRARISMGPRPRQQAPMRVLIGANMPAALVEFAYLSNPDQEKLAASEEYQNVVADGLFEAIVRFRVYLEEQRAR